MPKSGKKGVKKHKSGPSTVKVYINSLQINTKKPKKSVKPLQINTSEEFVKLFEEQLSEQKLTPTYQTLSEALKIMQDAKLKFVDSLNKDFIGFELNQTQMLIVQYTLTKVRNGDFNNLDNFLDDLVKAPVTADNYNLLIAMTIIFGCNSRIESTKFLEQLLSALPAEAFVQHNLYGQNLIDIILIHRKLPDNFEALIEAIKTKDPTIMKQALLNIDFDGIFAFEKIPEYTKKFKDTPLENLQTKFIESKTKPKSKLLKFITMCLCHANNTDITNGIYNRDETKALIERVMHKRLKFYEKQAEVDENYKKLRDKLAKILANSEAFEKYYKNVFEQKVPFVIIESIQNFELWMEDIESLNSQESKDQLKSMREQSSKIKSRLCASGFIALYLGSPSLFGFGLGFGLLHNAQVNDLKTVQSNPLAMFIKYWVREDGIRKLVDDPVANAEYIKKLPELIKQSKNILIGTTVASSIVIAIGIGCLIAFGYYASKTKGKAQKHIIEGAIKELKQNRDKAIS